MNRSVQPSFSIDSVIANLSESTEIDCSDEGTQFSEMIEKYQNETHTIQSILNTLYQQIDRSLSPSSQKKAETNNISISASAIKELQERLRALEKENEELSSQMKHFAAMSDISSFQINNSKQFSQQSPQSYKFNSTIFSDINPHRTSMNVSKESQVNDSYWQSKYKELLNQNQKLSNELHKEREFNKELKNSHTAILSSIHNLVYEIADQKLKTREMLNSFKNELINIRLQTLHQLRNQSGNSPKFTQKNILKTNEKSKMINNQTNLNSTSSLVIQGCEELIDTISMHFKGIQKISINEIIYNPKEFTRYINLIQSHLDMNVQNLKTENKTLTQDLSLANNKIRSSTISPEIQNAIKKVMTEINKVSIEMQNEHEELLAQLG